MKTYILSKRPTVQPQTAAKNGRGMSVKGMADFEPLCVSIPLTNIPVTNIPLTYSLCFSAPETRLCDCVASLVSTKFL